MQLYGVDFSPFVQRVLIAARIKGHDLPLAPLPGGSMRSEEYAAMSPMRRIPHLVDGDTHVCESGVIVDYLDRVLIGPPLWPEEPAARARALSIERIAEVEIAAGLRPFVNAMLGRPVDPAILEAARGQIARGAQGIEALLRAGDSYAAGEAPGAADALLIALFALAGIVAAREGAGMLGDRPKLAALGSRLLADRLGADARGAMATGFARMAAR